jgi:hypothetical protein
LKIGTQSLHWGRYDSCTTIVSHVVVSLFAPRPVRLATRIAG